MNRYDPNEPIQPFYVPAKVLKCSVSSPDEPAGGAPKPTVPFWGQLDPLAAKAAAAAVLAAAYFLVEKNPVFAPITVLLMLGATLFRLDERRRKIAIAPLVLAGLRVASQMSLRVAHPSMMRQAIPSIPTWVPLFLAACLVFAPSWRTVTEAILLVFSMVLLSSGLLPCEGYLVIFVMAEYMLFLAMVVGLTIDLTTKPFAARVAVAH